MNWPMINDNVHVPKSPRCHHIEFSHNWATVEHRHQNSRSPSLPTATHTHTQILATSLSSLHSHTDSSPCQVKQHTFFVGSALETVHLTVHEVPLHHVQRVQKFHVTQHLSRQQQNKNNTVGGGGDPLYTQPREQTFEQVFNILTQLLSTPSLYSHSSLTIKMIMLKKKKRKFLHAYTNTYT